MAESTEATAPKRRGRPKKEVDPNAPAKGKATRVLKLFVIPADVYEAFRNSSAGPNFGNMKDAMAAADAQADVAEASGNETPRFAIIEEVGILEPVVVKKVQRNFSPSRTVIRSEAPSAAAQGQGTSQQAATEGQTAQGSDATSQPAATATSESTASEGAPARRRNR